MKLVHTIALSTILFLSCSLTSSQENNREKKPPPPFTVVNACILSQLAYCDTPQKKIAQYLPGWSVTWSGSSASNYAFAATDGYHTAVAIRGSLMAFDEHALDNWLYQDMHIIEQVSWPYAADGKKAVVSKGAYDSWNNINKIKDKDSGLTLWDYLLKTDPQKPVHFTGHSLGGNIATTYASYAAARFKKDNHPRSNLNVITFAAPAIGNKAFADDFNATFPQSVRVENRNDLVPKFPCTSRIDELTDLFDKGPSAKAIEVGYKSLTVKLSTAFSAMSTTLSLLSLKGNDDYVCTNGKGQCITIPLSGRYKENDVTNWFGEAAYQHGIAQYAKQLGAPVITCE